MPDAVVLPGRMFGPGAPLLMYSGDAAERRGVTVHRHHWSPGAPPPFEPEIEDWVCGEVTPLLDPLGGQPLVIGKSMGSNAAGLAAERHLPAIWLTPLLSLPWIVAALDRATAPYLLVGGTADKLWDGTVARQLSPHVLEIEMADHGMYVPGPLTESIAVLGRIVVGVEEFLDGIGWSG